MRLLSAHGFCGLKRSTLTIQTKRGGPLIGAPKRSRNAKQSLRSESRNLLRVIPKCVSSEGISFSVRPTTKWRRTAGNAFLRLSILVDQRGARGEHWIHDPEDTEDAATKATISPCYKALEITWL